MPLIKKDEIQPGVYHFEETLEERENKELKKTLAELLERKKQSLVSMAFKKLVSFAKGE